MHSSQEAKNNSCKRYIRLKMKFVHSKLQECTKGELDLFSMSPTQVSLERGHWIDHQPVFSVTDSDPIVFLSPRT